MLDKLRDRARAATIRISIDWKVTRDDVGMGIANRSREIPASTFLSVNSVYILIFGLVFTALWGFLADRGLEPSTTVKFALGLLQLGWASWPSGWAPGWPTRGAWWPWGGSCWATCCTPPASFACRRWACRWSRGSRPPRLVSTVMGVWFLATAFSQLLAAIIAQFTSVKEGAGRIPVPAEDGPSLRQRLRQDRRRLGDRGPDLLRPGAAADPLDAPRSRARRRGRDGIGTAGVAAGRGHSCPCGPACRHGSMGIFARVFGIARARTPMLNRAGWSLRFPLEDLRHRKGKTRQQGAANQRVGESEN